MLDNLQCADFRPYLGQKFTVRLDGIELIELELECAREEGTGPPSAPRKPFSLMLLGPPSNQYLQQAIYRLEHPQLGVLDLFIVPLGLQRGQMRYEVIFS